MVNERVWNAVPECSLKNDRMISVRFQGKPFSITVIQVYAPTSNTEEAEVEQFHEDLQDLLELTHQKMSRGNIDILGINELKWIGIGELNSDDHYIYYCGQESLRRNGMAIIVNKRVQNAVLGCSLKNDRMISDHF